MPGARERASEDDDGPALPGFFLLYPVSWTALPVGMRQWDEFDITLICYDDNLVQRMNRPASSWMMNCFIV